METQGIPLALGPNDADDGESGRMQRGMAIAAVIAISKVQIGYLVPSASGNGSYVVSIDSTPYCSCPDFERRKAPCKHIYGVLCVVSREASSIGSPDGVVQESPEPKHKTYSQNWPAYNQAQTHEGDHFLILLRELCDSVEQPPKASKRGRPRLQLSDMLFGMGVKVYSEKSARRSMSYLRSAEAQGLMERLPSTTSCWRYMEKPEIKPILRNLVQVSARPLAIVESHFSPDSTGFSTSVYDRWFDHKWGETKEKKRAKFITAQLMVGAKTNVVTDADAFEKQVGDAPQLIPLLNNTLRHFDVRQVSADMGYLADYNLLAIKDAGADPLIPFREDTKPRKGAKTAKDLLWNRLWHYYNYNCSEFDRYYHRRSNVESAVNMIKSKFGGDVFSKNPAAQENEVLVKVVCHNIVVLIHEMYELNIWPNFGEYVPELNKGPVLLSDGLPTGQGARSMALA